MGVAAAIIGGAALAAGASAYGAKKSASSQKKATLSNNRANYRMFQEARGSEGSAVLPLYLRTRDGNLLEGQMGKEAADYWSDSANDKTPQDFENAAQSTAGARQSAVGLTNDIFSGGVTDRMLRNFQPVKDTRVRFKRQSSIDALNKTLSDIEAAQASKGFSGDSMGRRKLMFDANRRMYSDVADANLANVNEERAIRDYGDVQLPLQSLQLPYDMARAEANQLALPASSYGSWMQARQQPMRFFYIGPSQPFQYKEEPVGLNGWQVAGSSAGQIGGAAMSYYQQQQQMKQLQDLANQQIAMNNIYGGGVYQGAGGQAYYSGVSSFGTPMSMPVAGAGV